MDKNHRGLAPAIQAAFFFFLACFLAFLAMVQPSIKL
jgi:hypothetical protein